MIVWELEKECLAPCSAQGQWGFEVGWTGNVPLHAGTSLIGQQVMLNCCPIASRCEFKLKDGSVYSQPLPARLDKIKNFHLVFKARGVVTELTNYLGRRFAKRAAYAPCSSSVARLLRG